MRIGKAILLVTAIVLVTGLADRSYEQYLVGRFCNGIPENTTPHSVIELARKEKYSVLNLLEQRGELVITNHESPLWRFACSLMYENRVITARSVRMAD